MYIDSEQFANSWLVGPKWCRRRSVTSGAVVRQNPCLLDRKRQEAAKTVCRVFYLPELDKCRAKHDVESYFRLVWALLQVRFVSVSMLFVLGVCVTGLMCPTSACVQIS